MNGAAPVRSRYRELLRGTPGHFRTLAPAGGAATFGLTRPARHGRRKRATLLTSGAARAPDGPFGATIAPSAEGLTLPSRRRAHPMAHGATEGLHG